MIEFLTDYSWVIWVALILVFVIIEMMSLEFTFLMLAVGSVGGLVLGAVGLPWWAQIIGAGILSVVLLFLVKPPLHRALRRGEDPARTLIDALAGIEGTVTTDFRDGRGHVKLANGETWTARLSSITEQRPVQIGERVVVTAIEGATAVVIPAERSAS